MKVEIKQIDKIRLAAIEHRGDPKDIFDSVNKLMTWAKAQTINLKPKAGEAFARRRIYRFLYNFSYDLNGIRHGAS